MSCQTYWQKWMLKKCDWWNDLIRRLVATPLRSTRVCACVCARAGVRQLPILTPWQRLESGINKGSRPAVSGRHAPLPPPPLHGCSLGWHRRATLTDPGSWTNTRTHARTHTLREKQTHVFFFFTSLFIKSTVLNYCSSSNIITWNI